MEPPPFVPFRRFTLIVSQIGDFTTNHGQMFEVYINYGLTIFFYRLSKNYLKIRHFFCSTSEMLPSNTDRFLSYFIDKI